MIPLVSIVIPVYNAEKWLLKCLQSCSEQSYNNIEIVAVDDHSEDNSFEILQGYKDERLVTTQNKGKGAQKARNLGAAHAKGDYIVFLDSDDFLHTHKVEQQVHFLEQNPNVDVAYSDWEIHTYADNGSKTVGQVKHKAYACFTTELLKNNWSPPLNYMIRSEVVHEMMEQGGWDESISIFQDRHYFTSIALKGKEYGYCEAGSSIYNRWSKGTISQKQAASVRLELQKNLIKDFLQQLTKSTFDAPKKLKFRRILFTELIKVEHQLGARFDKEMRLSNINFKELGSLPRRLQILLKLAKQKVFG
jgi:glycosyltransferase involved in cell wall biosynthesis